LAHYLSAIGFVGLNPTPPNDYRFNVLRFGGMDDRRNNALIMRTGETYPFSFIVQNTGNNDWSLRCYTASPWHDTAISFHWYSYPNNQYISQIPYFEGARTGLCVCTSPCTAPLPPGREYPDQSQSSATAYANVYVNVSPNEYWLRLDVEFLSAYRWGSRLHPQDNQNNAQWPTQDIRVRVIANIPPAPVPGISSGQTPGQWSNNNTVTLAWAAVNDPLLHHYEVCRDKRNDGQGVTCENTSATSFSRTLADGIYDFEVTAVASDSKRSSPGEIDNIRLDATRPTAALTPLPIRVQAPTYLITWTNGDTGGSGLAQNLLEYQINGGAWYSVPAVNDPGITSILFNFPGGQHGDVYNFRLRTRDGASNYSDYSLVSTTFNPDPELHVSPLKITRYRIYTDTVPTVTTIQVENYGGDTLAWTATTPFTLAVISPTSGIAPANVTLTLTHPVGITATYVGYITITATTPGTHNSPQQVQVEVRVVERMNTYYLPVIFK
jgi:hypothetical protein